MTATIVEHWSFNVVSILQAIREVIDEFTKLKLSDTLTVNYELHAVRNVDYNLLAFALRSNVHLQITQWDIILPTLIVSCIVLYFTS